MTALMRRRMMMAAKEQGGGDSPLYQLYQSSSVAVTGAITYACTGNHVYFKTTLNSRGPHVNTALVSSSMAASATTIFSLHAGDVVEMRLKNVVYTIGSSNTRMNVAFREGGSSGTTIFSVGDQSFSANTSGTAADITATATIAADCDINDVYFYLYRAAEFEFDLEFYVNGTRYL